jgi:AmmeMemoRadiSam system protein B
MRHNTIREASVAGSFYSSNRVNLINDIKCCFENKYGPGKIPSILNKKMHQLKGVIVPHAGISYSGAIAAHSYLSIVEDGFADCYIIIGPNHRGIGSSVALYPPGKWESPIGDIIMDEELIDALSGDVINVDEQSHPFGENSIEVQLPFLKYISDNRKFSTALISMALQDFETSKKVGEKIAEVVKRDSRKILIISSSDFSHEGFPYGRLPPKDLSADSYARIQDKLAIEKIKKFDASGLIKTVYNNKISMCGYGAIATLLVATKELGANKVELLKYITSNDIEPSDYCVGYGSFKIL